MLIEIRNDVATVRWPYYVVNMMYAFVGKIKKNLPGLIMC